MIRIAIVGCGWAGRHQAQGIMSEEVAPRMRIVAAADSNKARLQECGAPWQLCDNDLYGDYQELLRRDDIDAVSVCLPTYLHHESGLAVLESGRHLLVEKPITATVAEGRALVEAAERAGRVLMVAESACFTWGARQMARVVAEGLIGRPLLARGMLIGKLRGDWGGRPWLLDRQQAGGGMFMTNGIHCAAVMRKVLGEVSSVFARRVQPQDDSQSVVDTIVANLQFDSGCLGEIVMSLNIEQYEQRNGYLFHGSDGTVLCRRARELNNGFTVYAEQFDDEPREFVNPHPERTSFMVELGHFADCIGRQEEPETSGRDQLRSLAVIEAGHRSIETGQPEVPAA